MLSVQCHQQKVHLSTGVFVGVAMTMLDGQRRRSYPTPQSTMMPDGNKLAKTRGESVDMFSCEARPKFAHPSTEVFVGVAMAKQQRMFTA